MVVTNKSPRYQPPGSDFKPLPKYGKYSEVDPEFAKIKDMADMLVESVWDPATSLTNFRAMWKHNSTAPKDAPKEDSDVLTSTQMITTRGDAAGDGNDAAEIEIKIYKARNKKPGSALVLRFHGGGWVVGGHNTENTENLIIAGRTNSVVVSVAFRMAPEHRFPTALDDCYDGFKWASAAKENAATLGADPNKIITIGSSAGSQLAAVVTLQARDEGITGIIGQVLSFPIPCHPKFLPTDKYEIGSWKQNAKSSVLDAVKLEYFMDSYMPEPTEDWRFSPLLAKSLKSLPPSLVQVGGADVVRDDGIAYAERMKSEGADVELEIYPGLPHCFYTFTQLPQTAQYYDRITNFINKLTG